MEWEQCIIDKIDYTQCICAFYSKLQELYRFILQELYTYYIYVYIYI